MARRKKPTDLARINALAKTLRTRLKRTTNALLALEKQRDKVMRAEAIRLATPAPVPTPPLKPIRVKRPSVPTPALDIPEPGAKKSGGFKRRPLTAAVALDLD